MLTIVKSEWINENDQIDALRRTVHHLEKERMRVRGKRGLATITELIDSIYERLDDNLRRLREQDSCDQADGDGVE